MKIVIKNFFSLLLTIIGLLHFVNGQERKAIQAGIYAYETATALKGINVLNLSTKSHAVSDNYGKFSIDYKTGDTLEFRHENWETKQFFGNNLNDSIYLKKKGIVLQEILVTGTPTNNELKITREIQKQRNNRNGIYYGGRPPLSLLNPFSGKPLTFFYELISKNGFRARKMERNILSLANESKIDSLFTLEIIRRTTNIKEEELVTFVEKYRPTVSQSEHWNRYDFLKYIQGCYQQFVELKEN
ncbi:hypothetical protein GCM10022216_16010 [Sphingobacterium kyonggiense]|uniref:Carboxypeptidase-like protein n=1 Tax=Sphingobacterium kyonggiense TaxID=714075 RepID=A0ABP7YN37_9SPHI